MKAAERAAAVRLGAGLFPLAERGLLAVRGSDRRRWLDGMLSNRIAELAPGPSGSGCYALLLTAQGRIVADLHVLAREEELWLELDGGALAPVRERLERYVISEDVVLEERSAEWVRLSLEGPRAPELLARLAGEAPAFAPDCGGALELAGCRAWVAAWGWSGAPAFQLWVAPREAPGLRAALVEAGADLGLVLGDAEALEVLRIEAGRPRFGSELSEDVLPAEAGLVGRAASTSKGCYVGQEIVARMASRGQAGHRLVGFRFEPGEALPVTPAEVLRDARRVGELTSACRSALAGAIGLGYVRRGFEGPETLLVVGGARARVAELPFVPGAGS